VVQPVYDAVRRLAERTAADVGLLSGGGGAEVSGLVNDLWMASRDQISLETVVSRHGFHGPMEGELSSSVWREDSSPLEKIIEDYRALDESAGPPARLAQRRAERAILLPEVLAAVPAAQRPMARALLLLAERRLPLRGIAKRFMLQAFDVGRSSARRIGHLLTLADVLEREEDVFFLTADEVTGEFPADARAVVRERRRLHEQYRQLDLPRDWQGLPSPKQSAPEDNSNEIAGVGVSPGFAEGIVRVMTEPDFAAVTPGEILVTTTTDPSWSAIMIVCAALVVDIGGALSHAAVVARELGIPCVVNTRDGSRRLCTGDRVKVDGASGVVELIDSPVTR